MYFIFNDFLKIIYKIFKIYILFFLILFSEKKNKNKNRKTKKKNKNRKTKKKNKKRKTKKKKNVCPFG